MKGVISMTWLLLMSTTKCDGTHLVVGHGRVCGAAQLKRATDMLQQHQGARPDMAIDVELMIALKCFDCR